jgi:hypothetical protein
MRILRFFLLFFFLLLACREAAYTSKRAVSTMRRKRSRARSKSSAALGHSESSSSPRTSRGRARTRPANAQHLREAIARVEHEQLSGSEAALRDALRERLGETP